MEAMLAQGCDYCTGWLPTLRLKTRHRPEFTTFRICRACILVALKAIEDPEEYPAVIEDRDTDLERLKGLHA